VDKQHRLEWREDSPEWSAPDGRATLTRAKGTVGHKKQQHRELRKGIPKSKKNEEKEKSKVK
jgi:hypothetical protein